MIRVALVDDHPALRLGLETVLRAEPGIVPVGAAADAHEVWPLLYRTSPDVVLLDYHLPGRDGLQVCRRIKSEHPVPKVLLYSAYAGGSLAIPAAIAGADGLIGKGVPARELFEVIRLVHGGRRVLPPIPRQLLDDAGRRLDTADLPIFGMLLDDTPVPDIGAVLGLEHAELAQRIDRMLALLRFEVPEIDVRLAG